jgi:mono/diheme cytochrome c family protein
MTSNDNPVQPRRWCQIGVRLALSLFILAALVLAGRFLRDEPVVYEDPVEHFKYGSTGGERNLGFPYWIWRVLPEVCGDYLPGADFSSVGMLYEAGKDLPVGMSRRRHMGMDRVFLNCAVCHSSTVRVTPEADPILVVGMGANTLDLMGFQKFMYQCMADRRFTPNQVIPRIEAAGADLDLIDRYIVYPLAVHLMRDGVAGLLGRLRFIHIQPDWGPGRVDTFNSAKALFNFPIERLREEELLGASDFPTIWNQAKKQGMQLHWDGNNDRVEERNLNASFGTGATPRLIDHQAVARIQVWNATATPPAFGDHFPIDQELAAAGARIYQAYCADCHGASGSDFAGRYVGRVTPLPDIGTDRHRLQSFTPELAANLNTPYAGTEYRFQHFRKTFGYANAPLDGLWLRAPYLHNGSVPTMWDLLQPASQRPKAFWRGNDVYAPDRLGFVSDVAEANGRRYFLYDTSVPGNGNAGHEGAAYGTELADEDKWALIEYLKTF